MTGEPANSRRNDPDSFGPAKQADPLVATHTITLQRTTYRLPLDRAKALQAFLQQHVKAEVLQIEALQFKRMTPRAITDPKVNRQRIVYEPTMETVIKITTTPEVQKVIGQLITVMRKDSPTKHDSGPEYQDPRPTGNQQFNGGVFPRPEPLPERDWKRPTKSSALDVAPSKVYPAAS